MALDIYVGPLCRYHALNWKTVAEQMADAEGVRYIPLRSKPEEEVADQEEVVEAVRLWQTHTASGLAAQGVEIPLWAEDPALNYATDRPGWEGYWALVAKAQQLVDPKSEIPSAIPPVEELLKLPSMLAAQQLDSPLCLLSRMELWLPGDFDRMFQIETVTGHQLFATSLGELWNLLCALAERWEKSPEALESAPTTQPRVGSGLDEAALHGLAVLLRMTHYAMKTNLPMILDY